MRFVFKFIFFFNFFTGFSQEITTVAPKTELDSLYREDQFYFGVSINLLQNKPQNFFVNTISPSFTLGFLRDMPINKSRTKAIAIGLGCTYNKFSNNLIVLENNSQIDYTTIVANKSYDKNKLEEISIDVPLEVRWRNSTPDSHQFFRIYTGLKMSYLVFSKSKYVDPDTTILIFGNDELTKLRSSAYLTFGYNTWNAYVSYGFSPIFKSSAKLNKEAIGLNPVTIGFMFYIL
jgi:hypothetical protein